MQTVYISGANGYLGSRITLKALAGGFNVVAIVRANGSLSGNTRLRETLSKLSGYQSIIPALNNLQVIESDITHLGDFNPFKTGDQAPIFLHAAALVKTRQDQPEVWKTNVEGTRNALKFSKKINAKCFVNIGTAYSCGKGSYISSQPSVIEESTQASCFNNIYEKSKNEAEKLVRESGISYISLRPSILVHDQYSYTNPQDGASDSIGLFGWLKLIETVELMARKSDSRVKVAGNIDSKLNFIDVDATARIMSVILQRIANQSIKKDLLNSSWLLTTNKPKSISALLTSISNHLGVKSLQVVKDRYFDPKSSAESFYQKYASFFTDYATQFIDFQRNGEINRLIGNSHMLEQLDLGSVDKVIEYYASISNIQKKIAQSSDIQLPLSGNNQSHEVSH